MEMAKYILSILKSQLCIVFSWGFHTPIALENGLQFRVNGFKHRGWVQVKYNEGLDLFEVYLLSPSLKVVKELKEVYVEDLVEVIDEAVEKVEDYKSRVRQNHSLL